MSVGFFDEFFDESGDFGFVVVCQDAQELRHGLGVALFDEGERECFADVVPAVLWREFFDGEVFADFDAVEVAANASESRETAFESGDVVGDEGEDFLISAGFFIEIA